jgi:hypothetical protein
LPKSFEESVDILRLNEPIVARFEDMQGAYFPQIAQFATFVCSTSAKLTEAEYPNCALGVSGALINGAQSRASVENAVKQYARLDTAALADEMKNTLADAAKIAQDRYGFSVSYGAKLTEFRSACSSIQLYIKAFTGGTASELRVVAAQTRSDRSSMAYSFNWEYVEASTGRCFSNGGLGGSTLKPVAAIKDAAPPRSRPGPIAVARLRIQVPAIPACQLRRRPIKRLSCQAPEAA